MYMYWLLLPLELWDYVFRHHVVDEHDALRLAQTCTTLWEVYKSNGVKEWAWHNRWIREVDEVHYGIKWKGTKRWSDDNKECTWRALYTNGQLNCERHFGGGELHGLDRGWHASGKLWWEHYWVDGERHGFEREWYDNGQLRLVRHWANGKLYGLRNWWDQNGVMMDGCISQL